MRLQFHFFLTTTSFLFLSSKGGLCEALQQPANETPNFNLVVLATAPDGKPTSHESRYRRFQDFSQRFQLYLPYVF